MFVNARSSVYQLTYPFVFVTKYRPSVFESNKQKKDRLDLLESIAAKKGLTIHKSEAGDDPIHLMITIPPKIAISDAVKSLKGTSAREGFKRYPETREKLWGGH